MTSKNIASSKIPMVVRRKRGCHSGHPQAQLVAHFWIIAWDAGASPSLGSSILYSFIHRKITQNLKTSITQNSNKTFVRSVSIRKQTTTISTVSNQFIFYYCIISTVSQLLFAKPHQRKPQNHQNKHTTQRKQNLSKTQQSVAI